MELLGPLALSTLIVDYNYSLHGLEPDSDEYRQHQQLSEVHSAKRIFSLCEANKGFYVKAGQFVVALRQVPKEYSWTLSSLQDQFGLTFHACAVSCDFNTITAVLVKNLGQGLSDLFLSFDEEPIAAASIAHIHRAMLKDHEEVAIKVQYPGLEKQIKIGASVTAMSFPASSVSWFDWMVSEFEKRMSLEFGFDEESGIDNASCSGHKDPSMNHDSLYKKSRSN